MYIITKMYNDIALFDNFIRTKYIDVVYLSLLNLPNELQCTA